MAFQANEKDHLCRKNHKKRKKTNNNPDEMSSLFIACQFHQKWVLFLIFFVTRPGI